MTNEFSQKMNYKISVKVENRDGQLIFQQEVDKPEDLIKVAEVLPTIIGSFDSAKEMIMKAIFPDNDNPLL
jgi:hypothetical protein